MTAKGYKKPFKFDELDLAILREMPPAGSKNGKYLHHGVAIRELPGKIDGELPTSNYAGRVRSLVMAGFLTEVKGATKGERIYQRTDEGDAALKPKLREAAG